jgi:Flp pilus assembly protein TadG
MQHVVKPATERRRARKTDRTRGQSLVELALVLPVLLLLVLAAGDLGRSFFARIAVSNAAREGAYEASYNGTYVANTACSNSNSVMCAVLNEAQSSLTIAPADVAWSCTGSGGCSTGTYGDRVTITVNGHFQLLTPILSVFFGGTNVTFSSTASADIVSTPFTGAAPTAAPTVTPVPTPSPVPTASQIVTIPPGPTMSATPSAPTCNLPSADFGWTQQNKNRPVVFTSASSPTTGSCQITFYRWEYGAPDNTTDAGNLPTVSHDFALDGTTYVVTLTVTNARGTVAIQKSVLTAG